MQTSEQLDTFAVSRSHTHIHRFVSSGEKGTTNGSHEGREENGGAATDQHHAVRAMFLVLRNH